MQDLRPWPKLRNCEYASSKSPTNMKISNCKTLSGENVRIVNVNDAQRDYKVQKSGAYQIGKIERDVNKSGSCK